MNAIQRDCLRLALSLGLAAGALPQDAPQGQPIPTRAAPVSVLRAAHGLFDAGATTGGGIRGGGADYKVDCTDRGIDYVPALGRRASRPYPFRLTLESVGRGAATACDRAHLVPRAPRREGARAVYDRAPGLCERCEVRADGVELSYRFAAPLAGHGDLVVRLRLETDLALQPADGRAGLRFHAEGLGGVRVGGVTGIDALGRSAAGGLRLEGDHLELSLPQAFVASAAYPLVLDPLIGTDFLVETGGWDDINPDVAYDQTNDVYLVCWQREFAATDVDIRAQRVDSAGGLVGSFLAVRSPSSGAVAINPTVGNVAQTDRFLVAWQEGASLFGPWDIRGACVDAADGAVSADVAIAATAANEIDPDAASDGTGTDNEAVLVWTAAGTGIRGAQVTCAAGGGAPAPFAAVAIDNNAIAAAPAIAKNGGGSARYLVVWRHPPFENHAVAVDRNMTVLTPIHNLSAGDHDEMHVLGCLDQPSRGSYRFAGQETPALRAGELAVLRRRIGFVFQSFHLLPGLTAQQNAALPLRYVDVGLAERMRRAAAVLARVGLGERIRHRPSELSGGQQQRVAVARALVTRPDLLLADEPTGNLDSRSGAEITALLEELWREGRTLVVVTLDVRLAARARRVVRLLDGRVVGG